MVAERRVEHLADRLRHAVQHEREAAGDERRREEVGGLLRRERVGRRVEAEERALTQKEDEDVALTQHSAHLPELLAHSRERRAATAAAATGGGGGGDGGSSGSGFDQLGVLVGLQIIINIKH